MRDIGRIVRLQIQRGSLKTGEKPTRVYDPTPLLAVDRLALGPDGALGEGSDGSWLVDVHHRAHPRTKNEDGAHGVSLGFTSHYALMRDRFGERITLGCAGENIIVETERRMVFADLERGVALLATDDLGAAERKSKTVDERIPERESPEPVSEMLPGAIARGGPILGTDMTGPA